MLVSNRLAGRLPIFLYVSLLKDAPIRPIISILKNGQDYQVEDLDLRQMADKIDETEKELSHSSNR